MNTYLSPKTALKSTTGTAGKPEQKTTMKRRTMRTTEEKMPFNMHCSFSFFFKDNRTQTHDKQLLSINGRYISQSTEWEWKKMSFDYMIMAISGLELTPYSFAHFNKLSKQFLCPNIELHKRRTIFIVSTWRGVFNFSQNHVS